MSFGSDILMVRCITKWLIFLAHFVDQLRFKPQWVAVELGESDSKECHFWRL